MDNRWSARAGVPGRSTERANQLEVTLLKSLPLMKNLTPALWANAKLRVARWNRTLSSRERLRDTQLQILRSHLSAAAMTEFGRAHGFAQIHDHAGFQERVPVGKYGDFEPLLQRMRNGERDVLAPGLIPYFGQSSGTSNTAAKNKFLPVSMEQIRWQQKAGFDVFNRYMDLTNDRDILGGYQLALLPTGKIVWEHGVGTASNPGIMQHHMPLAARPLTLPRPPIRDIEDYDDKLSQIAAAYLDHDVRVLMGTTCWFSLLFDRVIEAARARGRNVSTVGEVWPNLRALFGGGIHAEPYRRIIEERVGHPVVLMDNYNATEGGIFACTDRQADGGMIMVPDRGVFYEFVARSEHGKAGARRVPLWDVEPGIDYAIVLTTSSGLYGYDIGDYVRFSSVFPHRMEFAGRASGVLSVTQELTTSLELEKAVTAATREYGCTVVDFSASSEVGVAESSKGRYVFFVEFERAPKDLIQFTAAVDRELCNQNRVYREHRMKDVAILPPSVVPLSKGATQKFMQALGQNSVQQKFPRIVDERRRDLLKALARPSVEVSSVLQ